MKTLILMALILTASAQTNSVPDLPAGIPRTNEEIWTWVVSFATVFIVYLFGKIPQLPRPMLPLMTPLIGILLGLGLRQLEALHLSWVDMGQVGALAVFLREAWNQTVTKQLQPREESKTIASPMDGAVAVQDTTAAGKKALLAADKEPPPAKE
jgi:hypothetical protein